MSEEKTAESLENPQKEDNGQPQAATTVAAEAAGRAVEKSFPRTGPSWLTVCALCLLVSMLTSAGSVYVYDRHYAQKIVSIDVKGYIAKQRDLYLAGKLTDEQFKGNIDKLDALIKSIPENRVAIMGDAVIKNAKTEKLPD